MSMALNNANPMQKMFFCSLDLTIFDRDFTSWSLEWLLLFLVIPIYFFQFLFGIFFPFPFGLLFPFYIWNLLFLFQVLIEFQFKFEFKIKFKFEFKIKFKFEFKFKFTTHFFLSFFLYSFLSNRGLILDFFHFFSLFWSTHQILQILFLWIITVLS